MGHLSIIHHEGRIKLCNTMVWFSNEENQFSIVCYIKNHRVTKKKEWAIQTINPLIQRKKYDTGQALVSEVQGLSNRC